MRPKVLFLAALFAAFAIQLSSGAAPLQAEPDSGLAALGKNTFRAYCASCHGKEARGDGPVAEHLRVAPTDLTGITDRNGGEFPAERVAQIIDGREKVRGHGSSDMPIWGDAFGKADESLSDEQVRSKITNLVHFLESIQEP